MRRINVNLFPRGGYFFEDKDGSTHRSTKGWGDLIVRVTEYRRRNGLPEGDPKNEVHEQACQRNPNYCSEQPEKFILPPETRRQSMKVMILRWLADLRPRIQSLRFVPPAEAQARAEICLKCPRKSSLPTGCSSCRTAVREIRSELLGPNRKIDERLNNLGCESIGLDLGTATQLDIQRLDDPTLPSYCWMKREGSQ